MAKQKSLGTETVTSLPPLLEEFRIALQAEIEAAKASASNNSVPLNNGHKNGQHGSAFQYAFLIDSVLNSPDDTPCDFAIPGQPSIQATIVSVEGLRIVISIEHDLGQFVPIAYLKTDLSILMRKLIERIETNATANNPAASRMLGIAGVDGNLMTVQGENDLYPSQRAALESALGRNFTIIWGPPGTGKTFAIGTIAKHLYNSSRTVLIVSHTNTAVDQAIKRIAKPLLDHLSEGIVIRVGEVKDDELKTNYPDVLVSQQVERQSQELVNRKDELDLEKAKLVENLSVVEKNIAVLKWLESSDSEIQSAKANTDLIRKLESQLTVDEKAWSELKLQESTLFGLQNLASKTLEFKSRLVSQQHKKNKMGQQIDNVNSWTLDN